MSSSKFDEGALFAMAKMKEILEKRRALLELANATDCGNGLKGIFNQMDNYLVGLEIELEMNLVRELTRK